MLIVIGKIGCAKCMELKDKLTKEGKTFDYIEFDKLCGGKRIKYAKIIRNENDGHFPLVIDEDGNVIREVN